MKLSKVRITEFQNIQDATGFVANTGVVESGLTELEPDRSGVRSMR